MTGRSCDSRPHPQAEARPQAEVVRRGSQSRRRHEIGRTCTSRRTRHVSGGCMRRWIRVALVAALIVPLAVELAPTAQGGSSFAVGIPTIVDPIRGAGEPDIVVDNGGNALITGPGGSGSQTSWFWRSRDGGLTYPLLGPSGGDMICPASGGGDSLVVPDRATNTLYLTDQEALADIGSGVLPENGAPQTQCATAPAVTADRPFEAVFSAGTSAVSKAD